jgi:hypothetical protein
LILHTLEAIHNEKDVQVRDENNTLVNNTEYFTEIIGDKSVKKLEHLFYNQYYEKYLEIITKSMIRCSLIIEDEVRGVNAASLPHSVQVQERNTDDQTYNFVISDYDIGAINDKLKASKKNKLVKWTTSTDSLDTFHLNEQKAGIYSPTREQIRVFGDAEKNKFLDGTYPGLVAWYEQMDKRQNKTRNKINDAKNAKKITHRDRAQLAADVPVMGGDEDVSVMGGDEDVSVMGGDEYCTCEHPVPSIHTMSEYCTCEL